MQMRSPFFVLLVETTWWNWGWKLQTKWQRSVVSAVGRRPCFDRGSLLSGYPDKREPLLLIKHIPLNHYFCTSKLNLPSLSHITLILWYTFIVFHTKCILRKKPVSNKVCRTFHRRAEWFIWIHLIASYTTEMRYISRICMEWPIHIQHSTRLQRFKEQPTRIVIDNICRMSFVWLAKNIQ